MIKINVWKWLGFSLAFAAGWMVHGWKGRVALLLIVVAMVCASHGSDLEEAEKKKERQW